jgi:hypothetical protein
MPGNKPKVGEIWEIGNQQGNALVLVKDNEIVPTIFGPARRIWVLDSVTAEKWNLGNDNLCCEKSFIRRIEEAAK